MVGLTRTVVAPSVELTERRFKVFMWLVEIYRRMLIELVNYDFKKEHRLLKRDKYCNCGGVSAAAKPLYSHSLPRLFDED
jgi:hypothetical protein